MSKNFRLCFCQLVGSFENESNLPLFQLLLESAIPSCSCAFYSSVKLVYLRCRNSPLNSTEFSSSCVLVDVLLFISQPSLQEAEKRCGVTSDFVQMTAKFKPLPAESSNAKGTWRAKAA